jgi:hypothetical protein
MLFSVVLTLGIRKMIDFWLNGRAGRLEHVWPTLRTLGPTLGISLDKCHDPTLLQESPLLRVEWYIFKIVVDPDYSLIVFAKQLSTRSHRVCVPRSADISYLVTHLVNMFRLNGIVQSWKSSIQVICIYLSELN